MNLATRTLVPGLLASLLSTLVLLWRGHREAASALSPINAVSHWIWPRSAFQHADASARYTGTGLALHTGSALFWAAIYSALQMARPRRDAASAIGDAAVVSAVAAAVDLKFVPERLTPGFERKLSTGSLALVYGSFGLGLAIGGLLLRER